MADGGKQTLRQRGAHTPAMSQSTGSFERHNFLEDIAGSATRNANQDRRETRANSSEHVFLTATRIAGLTVTICKISSGETPGNSF